MGVNLNRLPEPDDYGNYWLASSNKDKVGQPAIFPIKGDHRREGQYYLSLGDEILFGGDNRFMAFDSPLAALKELRRRLG